MSDNNTKLTNDEWWDGPIEEGEERNSGFPASFLKRLAFITIALGSFAKIFLSTFLLQDIVLFKGSAFLYYLLMFISGIGMPLLVLFSVEGYRHTSNHGKYIVKLFLVAIVIEFAYDLAYHGVLVYWGEQSPAFSFVFIQLALLCVDKINVQDTYEGTKLWFVISAVVIVFTVFVRFAKIEMGFCNLLLACILNYYIMPKKFEDGLDSWNKKDDEGGSGLYLALSIVNLIYAVKANTWIYIFQPLLSRFALVFYGGEKGEKRSGWLWVLYPIHLVAIWALTCVVYGAVVVG